jgi:hypothetical protein
MGLPKGADMKPPGWCHAFLEAFQFLVYDISEGVTKYFL